jgi:homogentisate 1,2-dioxygenase
MYAKHSQGTVSRQGQANWPAGTFEEHHGRDGFAGEVSQLYRQHPTTQWTRVEGPIRPRGILLEDIPAEDAKDTRALPTLLMENADMTFSVTKRSTPTPYYFRNADGDVTILVQRGTGQLVSDYGALEYGPHQYLVIPKGTNYKLVPQGGETMAYVIETTAPVHLPDRGPLGHFLPFDVGVLDIPRLDALTPSSQDEGEWEIVVKRGGKLSSIFYPFDPMDVDGWQGNVMPYRLHLSDIRPLTSERLDVPPPAHATFEADGVWIITLAPRPWQSEASALIPPYHRNVDYDEVVVTLGGGDLPIPGVPDGAMSIVPGGMNHGPSAEMLDRPLSRFPFYILCIDTRLALNYTDKFVQYEDHGFADSQRFNHGNSYAEEQAGELAARHS